MTLNKWLKANRLSLAARSKARVCGRSLTRNVGSNPFACESCVLSGGGLSAGLNTHPEEYYLLWCCGGGSLFLMLERTGGHLASMVNMGVES